MTIIGKFPEYLVLLDGFRIVQFQLLPAGLICRCSKGTSKLEYTGR